MRYAKQYFSINLALTLTQINKIIKTNAAIKIRL